VPPLVQVGALTETQVEQLHALYQLEWWTTGRSLEDVRLVVSSSSLIVGFVESDSGRLVGFCRLLTDFVFRGMIFDVIVAEDWRGKGLGRQLMDAVIGHPRLERVRALWLCCRKEMAPFYEKSGFAVSDDVEWMIRVRDET
jgi:ribosomal protein S18 acetylase RimI-like enzyme